VIIRAIGNGFLSGVKRIRRESLMASHPKEPTAMR
jgi:hypothetical protein